MVIQTENLARHRPQGSRDLAGGWALPFYQSMDHVLDRRLCPPSLRLRAQSRDFLVFTSVVCTLICYRRLACRYESAEDSPPGRDRSGRPGGCDRLEIRELRVSAEGQQYSSDRNGQWHTALQGSLALGIDGDFA